MLLVKQGWITCTYFKNSGGLWPLNNHCRLHFDDPFSTKFKGHSLGVEMHQRMSIREACQKWHWWGNYQGLGIVHMAWPLTTSSKQHLLSVELQSQFLELIHSPYHAALSIFKAPDGSPLSENLLLEWLLVLQTQTVKLSINCFSSKPAFILPSPPSYWLSF